MKSNQYIELGPIELQEQNIQLQKSQNPCTPKRLVIIIFLLFILFLLSFFVYFYFVFQYESISVISWNMQDFGTTKLNNEVKMNAIKNIISPYDVILLSELEQSACDYDENCEMKTYFQENFLEHDFYMSPSLGHNQDNNQGKEQYGFLVRKSLKVSYGHYIDTNDVFSRPPYYIYIQDYSLYISNVHITASDNDAKKLELQELSKFLKSLDNIVVIGDINICIPNSINDESIRKDFQWIIQDQETTNINGRCAYDRIIAPKTFDKFGHAKVIRDENIPNLYLSDHYPIRISFFK